MTDRLQQTRIYVLVRDAQLAGEEAISIFRIVVAITLLILIVLVVASNAWEITADDAVNGGAGAVVSEVASAGGTVSVGLTAQLEINALNESIKIAALLLSGYLGFGIARANTRLFDNWLNAQQEIERVTSTFGRYVSADLAAQILQTDIESGGEEREATIVFVDIVEFTPATERLTADQSVSGGVRRSGLFSPNGTAVLIRKPVGYWFPVGSAWYRTRPRSRIRFCTCSGNRSYCTTSTGHSDRSATSIAR